MSHLDTIEFDFTGVISAGPSWLDEVLFLLIEEFGKDKVVCLRSSNPSVVESLKVIESK